MWVSLNCLSVNANLEKSILIILFVNSAGLPSESENLGDLPLQVRVAPGASSQPRVELLRPVRAPGPVTPKNLCDIMLIFVLEEY